LVVATDLPNCLAGVVRAGLEASEVQAGLAGLEAQAESVEWAVPVVQAVLAVPEA
jgi:hypothetical protein